jgi:hypothetical protein
MNFITTYTVVIQLKVYIQSSLEFEEYIATYAFWNVNLIHYDPNCWLYLAYLGEESSSLENFALDMLKKNTCLNAIYWLQLFIFWSKINTDSLKTGLSTV